MKPSEPLIAKHTGPGLLMKEFHNSTISLRGSMRGSFRNSPAICRNGGVNHDSPVITRWKKTDEEPNGHCRETSSLIVWENKAGIQCVNLWTPPRSVSAACRALWAIYRILSVTRRILSERHRKSPTTFESFRIGYKWKWNYAEWKL